MGEHTEKRFIYLSQKQGRNIHPEGRGLCILSNEEERSVSQKRGRNTPRERRVGVPNEECGKEVTSVTYTGQSFPVFVHIWPTILFLVSHPTGPRTLPTMRAQLFVQMDPTAEACGCTSTPLIMGWRPLPFWPQGDFLHMDRQGIFPWPQEWSSYLFTSAELSFCH